MDPKTSILRHKRPNRSKLKKLGFREDQTDLYYQTKLTDSGFQLELRLTANDELHTKVIDSNSGEEYRLHLSKEAIGSFVGTIRSQYEEVLEMIAREGYDLTVFQTNTSKALIEHVRKTYDAELEFLWLPNSVNAIWRRSDNQKWFGVMMQLSARKLGLDSDEILEVLNLTLEPEEIEQLVDYQHYFPGWHMNKSYWITVLLDGSIALDDISEHLATSFHRAKR